METDIDEIKNKEGGVKTVSRKIIKTAKVPFEVKPRDDKVYEYDEQGQRREVN